MKKHLFVILSLALMAFATGCGSKSIDLNMFMEIQVSGYDGYGAANAVFDDKAFQTALKEAVGDKVQVSSVTAAARNAIQYQISPKSGLSNGDTIQLDWDVDREAIKKEAGVVLTCSQVKKSVSELKAIEEYDASKDIRFVSEGYSGSGNISVDTSRAKIKGLRVQTDKTSGLSNGDVLKVTLSLSNLPATSSAADIDAYTAENYGLILKEKSFRYTVDSLEELEVYDIFKDAKIVTEGYNGYGSIKVDLSGTRAKDLKAVISKEQDLSNGDVVSITVLPPYGSEDASTYTGEQYGLALESQLMEYTVSSLKELEEYDYFSEIQVSYSGTEPVGKLEVDASGVQIPGLFFEADKTAKLKNTDKIVLSVKCNEPDMERHLASFGYKLNRTQAEYTVEGLGTYWFDLEEVEGTPALKEMDEQARDALRTQYQELSSEYTLGFDHRKVHSYLNSMNYLGAYLVKVKPLFVEKLDEDAYLNKLCLIYRIDVLAEDGEEKKIPYSYYSYAEYQNVEKTAEGEWKYSLSDCIIPDFYSNFWGLNGSEFFRYELAGARYYYGGFQSLEELIGKRITPTTEKYSYESNVDENAPQTQSSEIPSAEMKPDLSKVKAGDKISFGQYEQDGDPGNGAEPIEWIVFTANEEKVWLISRYVLDAVPFNKAGGSSNYGNSSVNRWLNADFLNAAFSRDEQELLQTLWADPASNPQFPGASQGSDVYEKVALLSIEEIEEYLPDDQIRMTQGTQYTRQSTRLSVAENGNSPWWTRTMGSNNTLAALARSDGSINYEGRSLTIEEFGIRPCICLSRSLGDGE